jgi:hypothetical protein
MADSKISALPASTTPLAGTEVLPIVQSSTTRQVSVANLTAGRAISATQLTLTTGNLIVASGQGIDFSATSGTGTSELLNDYEEGTWTPDQGAALVVVGAYSSSGTYTKVGRLVTVTAIQNGATSIATGSSNIIFSNLPFNVGAFSRFSGVTAMQFSAVAGAIAVSGTGNVYSAGALSGGTSIVTTISYEV